jgi:hypothetical protein
MAMGSVQGAQGDRRSVQKHAIATELRASFSVSGNSGLEQETLN